MKEETQKQNGSKVNSPLTREQERAISHQKGPACVIAGAGTGKTTVLAGRLFFLVNDQKIKADRIIVTTFTRKATAELYERAFQRLGEKAHQLRISTIDALIWELALELMHRKLMQPVRLLGEASQRVLLLYSAWEVFGKKDVSSRESWSESADKAGLVNLLEQSTRAEIASKQEKQVIYSSIQRRLQEMENMFYLGFDFRIPNIQDLRRTAKRYYEKLKELSATDYEMLSRDFLLYLKRYKNLARKFASQSDAILVDEFQDTSRIQAEILLLLSGKDRNIWVVGDPCQQIYEWRGAGPENLLWFIKATKAKKYYLTDNWRSTQAILDCGYHFLSSCVPSLKRNGMLKLLTSKRDQMPSENQHHHVYTATLERALFFVKQCLKNNPDISPSDVAILSSKLTKKTREEIEHKASAVGLKVQFYSSRADHSMERTIGSPPPWKPGKVLNNLYKHPKIQKLVSHSLRVNNFGDLRTIRSLAMAAEAIDSTLPLQAFTFTEAWTALKITQDREVSVSSAVVNRHDSVQVMTIHAAKGLEFPVVLLMKIRKGGRRSFPNLEDPEDCRLAYVGVTRARDILILVHTQNKPNETLGAFGNNLVPVRKTISAGQKISAPSVLAPPPIIAATHLDLYEQCPLKFAAYHEGRFLPNWSISQSMGARMHKAIEYYLQAEMPTDSQLIWQCFTKGFQDGDSPLRKLPRKSLNKMKESYKEIVKNISKESAKILAIEERYRYLHGAYGQVDGVVDALIVKRDRTVVLKEWKTSDEVGADRRRQYELQSRVGAMGLAMKNSYSIQMIEIVPIFNPKKRVTFSYNAEFVDESKRMLEKVFKDLRDRKYEPQRGNHCKWCQLKSQCPAY